jgi:transcriptional regulator with XRE-family HTH domain
MGKIYYETNGISCLDKCSHKKSNQIGSMACQVCENNIDCNIIEDYVICKLSQNNNETTVISIGKAIRFWRKYMKKNGTEFAKITGYARSYISRLENATVGASIERLCEIATFLGVPPSTILGNIPKSSECITLQNMANNDSYEITKEELIVLFGFPQIPNKTYTKEFYLHQLAIMRSNIYVW